MNKIIQIAFIAVTIISLNAYSTIRQITENLYAARIPGRNLSLVMERIDDRTHKLWKKFISVQYSPFAVQIASRGMKGTTASGSGHFKDVLDEVSYKRNEIWIAYITRSNSPEPIPDHMASYSASNLAPEKGLNPFTKDIQMAFTVASSPNALITSHMGISSTAEAALTGRERAISVDLHSFAAKVMLMRNPGRRYMINAPVFVMEKIIIDALPKTATFVGTKEMLKEMLERQHSNYDDFRQENEADVRSDIEKNCQQNITDWHNNLSYTLKKGLENEGVIRNKLNKNLEPCLMLGKDGNPVSNPEAINKEIAESLREKFILFKNPYHLTIAGNVEEEGQKILELMEKHPPILSKDPLKFTIFEGDRPWLVINYSDKDYEWMWTQPFEPAGITHYFAVDLKVLANSKAIEDLGVERKPYQKCPHCGF